MPLEKNIEKRNSKKCCRPIRLFFIVLFAVLAVGLIYITSDYLKLRQQVVYLQSPEGQAKTAQNEVNKIIESLQRHMLLPEGEAPAVAEIQDAQTLADSNPFYKGSQNGDLLIIYNQAKKAIIYSLGRDLIINVGPVYFDEKGIIDLEIRNGSNRQGAAAELSEKFVGSEGINIIDVSDAKNQDYQGNIIINFSGIDVTSLQKELNAQVLSELPEGERQSEADVLLIVGN